MRAEAAAHVVDGAVGVDEGEHLDVAVAQQVRLQRLHGGVDVAALKLCLACAPQLRRQFLRLPCTTLASSANYCYSDTVLSMQKD